MKKAYILHGFNVKDGGKNSVAKLVPFVESYGLEPRIIDYGFMHRLRVRLCNPRVARVLASVVEPGSVAIGHSNGCAIIHMATHLGARFDRIAYINPALDTKLFPAGHVSNFAVWHSPSDFWTAAAKWVPFSKWGNMGAIGYQGDDPRGTNYNMESISGYSDIGHSDVFREKHLLRMFGPQIAGFVSG